MDSEIKQALKACANARVELTSFFRNIRTYDDPESRKWAELSSTARAHVLAAEELLWNGIDPNIEGAAEEPQQQDEEVS